MKPSRAFKIDPRNDIVKVRGKLGLSQSKFAAILGISADTFQNWEQGRRQPTGPARVLLRIALKHPKLLLEVARSPAIAAVERAHARAPAPTVKGKSQWGLNK